MAPRSPRGRRPSCQAAAAWSGPQRTCTQPSHGGRARRCHPSAPPAPAGVDHATAQIRPSIGSRPSRQASDWLST
eukprot:911228-Prorocentrum_minimum.AAC.1